MTPAKEWRRRYYLEHGRPVEPGSMLGDVLNELRDRENEIHALQAQLATPAARQGEIDDLEREVEQLEEENDRLRRQCRLTAQASGPTVT